MPDRPGSSAAPDVPVQDEDKEVYFEVPATNRQIDLFQNLDSEKQCTVKVSIIDY